jgi:Na+/phosphate symporter
MQEQMEELNELDLKVQTLYAEILTSINNDNYTELDNIVALQEDALQKIDTIKKAQIKRIRSHASGTKNSLMYLDLLGEIKNVLFYTINLLKSQRDFILEQNKKNAGS